MTKQKAFTISSNALKSSLKILTVLSLSILILTVFLQTLISTSNIQAQAATETADLILGSVDTGSTLEVSVCLRSTSGVLNLTDSSLWLGFDNSKLTPNPTIVTSGKYTTSADYSALRWAQVAPAPTPGQTAEKWALTTAYIGDETPNSTTVVPTTPELVGKVSFNKLDASAVSIIPVTTIFYSLESADEIGITVISQNSDCTSVVSSSSSSAVSSQVSSLSSSVSSIMSSSSTSSSSAISSVAQSSTITSVASSSSTTSTTSSSSSVPANQKEYKTYNDNGEVTLDIAVALDKTVIQVNEGDPIFTSPLTYNDNTIAANTAVKIKIVTPENKTVIFGTKTNDQAKVRLDLNELRQTTRTSVGFDFLFQSLNVQAADPNLYLISGNPQDLNALGDYKLSLIVIGLQQGQEIESAQVSFKVVASPIEKVLPTLARTGGVTIISTIFVLLAMSLVAYLIWSKNDERESEVSSATATNSD